MPERPPTRTPERRPERRDAERMPYERKPERRPITTLTVTPDMVIEWCKSPVFELFKAQILKEADESRLVLESIPSDKAATISFHQGKIALSNFFLDDEFPVKLAILAEDEVKRDGGEYILFSLRMHEYRRRNMTP